MVFDQMPFVGGLPHSLDYRALTDALNALVKGGAVRRLSEQGDAARCGIEFVAQQPMNIFILEARIRFSRENSDPPDGARSMRCIGRRCGRDQDAGLNHCRVEASACAFGPGRYCRFT
jgi:hypothetical protein